MNAQRCAFYVIMKLMLHPDSLNTIHLPTFFQYNRKLQALSKSLLSDDYELADLRPQRKAAFSTRSQGFLFNGRIVMF